VSDAGVLVDALHCVIAGECVIDQEIVARLMQQQRSDSPVNQLSDREWQILSLMAPGRSNAGIAQQLVISDRTVESTCAQVFRKLGFEPDPADNRRVLAVLAVLRPSRNAPNQG
jgi:DNA-binding NarL/FixJ family response regulator